MSNSLRALAAVAALTLGYAATSAWVHPLPLTVAALVTSAVCVLVFHFAFQLTLPHDAPAPVVLTDVHVVDGVVSPDSPRYAGARVCCPTVADDADCLHSTTYAVLPLDVV